jgi:SRSO17 transposase
MDMAVGQVARPWRGVGQWVDAVTELHGRIARRFARSEVRERARRYLVGLRERVESKNGWQLAETIGEAGPRGVQRLLSAATWDAEEVRDDLRAYVVDHLGDAASGVPIIDDTRFVKKGDTSCGVGRQYTGTVGDTANAQVGVFLAYASEKGAASWIVPSTCPAGGRMTRSAAAQPASPRRCGSPRSSPSLSGC